MHYVQADALAEEAGNMKTVNTVMLGALSSAMALDASLWEKAIEECVRPQFIEVNKKALALGRQIG